MSKVWTISRRTAIAIVAISAVAIVVSGALLSNYLVPSTVNITSQPGITVVSFQSSDTSACTGGTVTSFTIGDVQQGQSKQFATICIKNAQGSNNQFILPQSLTTTTPLPSGITLTWNFPGSSPTPVMCGSVSQCIGIAPSQQTPPLQLTLTASTSAPSGTLSFTIEFDAFSTASG